MFKAALVVSAMTVASLASPARASETSSLPCNALCQHWMGWDEPSESSKAAPRQAAVDLHPDLMAEPIALPPALLAAEPAGSVPPAAQHPRRSARAVGPVANVPVPPVRPRFTLLAAQVRKGGPASSIRAELPAPPLAAAVVQAALVSPAVVAPLVPAGESPAAPVIEASVPVAEPPLLVTGALQALPLPAEAPAPVLSIESVAVAASVPAPVPQPEPAQRPSPVFPPPIDVIGALLFEPTAR